MLPDPHHRLEAVRRVFPEKFASLKTIFGAIKPGARIFVSSACAEPQYAIRALQDFIEEDPKAIRDTEVFQVWAMSITAYTNERYKEHFRHNAFFIGMNARDAVNTGFADYTPVFLSEVPELFYRKIVPIDVAIIQTSSPDQHGHVSLGVSLDITKAAVENASLVIAQVNAHMPRVQGDTFIHLKDIDYIIPFDEPILEFENSAPNEISTRIGQYAAKIINDGDTIQVGYGSIPNGILPQLSGKKRLGVHTELLTDGIIELMRSGVIDNSRKTLIRGKTIASFCMGNRSTYEYIHNNPTVEFRTIDYINNPLVIARNDNMTAINAALQIDLTGQATADSLGTTFFSGIGGIADFTRGSALSPGGKSILLLQSTSEDGELSSIAPSLDYGAGVTISRGDVKYVVTEYGIAYLFGKNIRERAMALIAVAHPKFRPWLIEEAKKRNIIYKDQAFIHGKKGEYPEELERKRITKKGVDVLFRPVKITDEPLLKEFFYSLSDTSLYRRFITGRVEMSHEKLQEIVVIDYTKEMIILASKTVGGREVIIGVGQYSIFERNNLAEFALVIRDDYQNLGIGAELTEYLQELAIKQGLVGFYAQVILENRAMLHIFENLGVPMEKHREDSAYEVYLTFPSGHKTR